MSERSSMILIGIGGAGTTAARLIRESFGDGMRYLLTDTDASSGRAEEPFVLLGGDRLSGHGAGGDVVAARLAAESGVSVINPELEGVRLAVIVTCLGGGTGAGATLEIVRHLSERGIPSVVFATTPFTFEGEDRQRNARGVMAMIEDDASATFFIPLDRLVRNADNMAEAMALAVSTFATGITFFWRLIEKPGYIRLDAERMRNIIRTAGRGRFASVETHGANRAHDAVEALVHSDLLATGTGTVGSILCGILAGEDLRLSEISTIADGLCTAFGNPSFNLATVNDERKFGGRICVIAFLFESDAEDAPTDGESRHGRRHLPHLGVSGNAGRGGRFANSEQTLWHGKDLDTPTYVRDNILLDF